MTAEGGKKPVGVLAVDVRIVTLAVSADEQLVVRLSRRVTDPMAGAWYLPGDFADLGDVAGSRTLEEFAALVYAREAGQGPGTTSYLGQFRTYLQSADSPLGTVLTVAFLAVVRDGQASEGEEWLPVDAVLATDDRLAFGHDVILRDAVQQVRELLETTALALAFCEEKFTIPRLRRIYEIVWGLRRDYLDAGTFHKRIMNAANLLEEVPGDEGRAPAAGRGRPPQLYRAGTLVFAGGEPMRLDRPIEQPGRSWVIQTAEPRLPEVLATRAAAAASAAADVASGSLDREAVAQARRFIWERGACGEPVRYSELAAAIGVSLRSAGFFELLDTLCRQEDAAGGPLVTALVVNKRTGIPGQRFFVLADSLGRRFESLSEFAASERARASAWIQEHPERASVDEAGEPATEGWMPRAPECGAGAGEGRPGGGVPASPAADTAALAKARGMIWERGARSELITYGDLAQEIDANLRSPAFFDLLDTLCREEDAAGGPMITALVVNKRSGMPGQRFFALARELGRRFDDETEFADGERIWAIEWIRAHPERARLGDRGAGTPNETT